MRKFILFTAAALLFVGCEDEDDQKITPMPMPGVDTVTILATNEAIPFSLSDETYTPEWQEGDQIYVDYGGLTYVYEAYESGTSVEFGPVAMSLPTDVSGSMTAWFNAPNGVFSVDSEQTGNKFPMYAHVSSASVNGDVINLTFKPLASILALTIEEADGKVVSSITIEPNDESGVTGSLAVSELLADPNTGDVELMTDAETSNVITKDLGTLSLGTGQTVTFCVSTGATVTGGFKITIVCGDGTTYKKEVLNDEFVQFSDNYVPAITSLFFNANISSYSDMVDFASECSGGNGGVVVNLMADIDMRNEEWTPITGFTGTFNGNGHYIYNINVSTDAQYAGFFAYAQGDIYDVMFGTKDGKTYDGSSKVEATYSEGTDSWFYAGIIARTNKVLENVTNFVPVTVAESANGKSRVGGVVGQIYDGTVKGCVNYGDVTNNMTATGAASYLGGVLGLLDGQDSATTSVVVEDCANYGAVTSTYFIADMRLGGVVGGITTTAYYPKITGCTNEGKVYLNNPDKNGAHYIGGILGDVPNNCANLTVSKCVNKGEVHDNVKGNSWTGGVVGRLYMSKVEDCENYGYIHFEEITGSSTDGYLCIAGVVGQTYSSATVSGCTNEGKVYSDKMQVSRIGGVVGTHNASTISNCVNKGDVTLNMAGYANNWEAVGGIAGFYDGTDGKAVTTGCTNYGNVSGTVNTQNANIGAGGIVGIIKSGDAEDSVNYGDISMHNARSGGYTSYAGGVVGYGYNAEPQNVKGCTNYGSAVATAEGDSSSMAAGGVLGRNDYTTVSGCANYGSATCTLYAGSLIGWNQHPLSDSVAGGSVNGTELTESNYEDLAVGHTAGSGTSTNITFGTSN